MKRSGREKLDAVIVGAGMVGAACALGLARAGMRVAVIEDLPAQAPSAGDDVDLRVVAVAPQTQRLLDALGVWQSIASMRVSPYARMQVVDAVGAAALSFNAADYGWPCLGHIVENRLIAGVLWQTLEREEAVRVHAGERLARFEVSERGVRVENESGSVLEAPLLIAADGQQSKVRQDLLIGVDGAPYAQTALVAHIEIGVAHGGLAWQRFLPGGPIAFLPLADGRASIVWTLGEDAAQRLMKASVRDFEAQLQRASAGRFGSLSLASERASFPLRLQIAQRFVDQRVILIGDAAHVVHPLAGQGVNLGFADVAALLASVDRAKAANRVPLTQGDLARWGRERRSEATLAAHAFDALNRLYAVADGPWVAARAFGLGLVDRLPLIKRKFAERAAGIRAGSR